MTFSIAIRTVPRAADYCRGTLSRLLDSGTLQHPSLLGLHLSHGSGLSPNANGCRALHLAAKDGADWIIFLEDDVDVIDDFLGSTERWLADWAKPDIRAYPLSCFYEGAIRGNLPHKAWRTYQLESYYGSQGFAIRTPDAVAFADWLTSLNLPRELDVSFDLKLAKWHKIVEPYQKYLVTPAPCFLDHTGEFSSIGPPGSWERVGRVMGFAGRTWSYR